MNKNEIDYSKAAASPAFQQLLKRKRAFIVPMTVFFLLFYFLLPIMTSYFTFLNQPAAGAISWAWLFAVAQFVMTWTLCILYTKKADQFDRMANDFKKEIGGVES
ncbi:DUF485 domain-containing protein [Bacillus swezeyi]|uniref:DUF485 domain-containing protein n=1 Tax=Bacillus swezeyi TaxID=1925020 RepID=A0A1R1S1B8_9BACI|nr:DUF485 domain-containing protein [Bacillus swezeyi]MEC1259160.1 DUF485 domain-containing protein [Bacillus swezeyi]MED2927879.1 DUF485 domain-containing protein [Bacillus swezeyi]MED2942139.1 DUF485 domain-containing protein [Bacillus swezeyi]MED2965209.1 DUF485 domain-containing protein [Bacillus swezeyi]MED2977685.1 DUF485 domain-containing protein [Bacillus swezeyi]